MEFILAFGKCGIVVLGIFLLGVFVAVPLILVLMKKIDPFLNWFGEKIIYPYYKWLDDKFNL